MPSQPVAVMVAMYLGAGQMSSKVGKLQSVVTTRPCMHICRPNI